MSIFTKLLIRQDWANHVIWGSVASALAIVAAEAIRLHGITIAEWLLYGCVGFYAAVIVGFAKDFIWDRKLGKGTFDYRDILATAVGGLIPMSVVWVK